MTCALRLLAPALALAIACPALGQADEDPVRLDDFAVASPDDSVAVDQLSASADRVAAPQRVPDRALATPPSAPPDAALAQISRRGAHAEQAQLSEPGAAPDESGANVSTRADSRPRAVARIAGTDRCDPQLDKAKLEECQRILERRADEFDAPAPPTLSAEQKLLAEQQSNDGQRGRSADLRLRLASRDEPDADLKSNQELAALYLDNQPAPVQPSQPDPAADGDATLAQVLEGLEISGQGQPAGN